VWGGRRSVVGVWRDSPTAKSRGKSNSRAARATSLALSPRDPRRVGPAPAGSLPLPPLLLPGGSFSLLSLLPLSCSRGCLPESDTCYNLPGPALRAVRGLPPPRLPPPHRLLRISLSRAGRPRGATLYKSTRPAILFLTSYHE
jgi:hypothetical protein